MSSRAPDRKEFNLVLGKEDENWEMIDSPETQDDVVAGQVKTSRLRRWFGANKGKKQKGKAKENGISPSKTIPESNDQEEVFYDASETTPLLSENPTPTYVSPFSPHFDHIPSSGPGEYNNDCQTFYEATADIHLWAKEKIVCYVDDLEIIEDHFATKEGEDDGREMWVDEGDDVCLLKGGNGITGDYVPRRGKTRGRATKRTDEKPQPQSQSQPETEGGLSG